MFVFIPFDLFKKLFIKVHRLYRTVHKYIVQVDEFPQSEHPGVTNAWIKENIACLMLSNGNHFLDF